MIKEIFLYIKITSLLFSWTKRIKANSSAIQTDDHQPFYVQSCGLIPFSMNNATQYCFIKLLKGAVSKHLDTAPSINL